MRDRGGPRRILGRLRLARWLGPWADEARAPTVRRRELTLPGPPPVRARLYLPKRPTGSLLLVPGLHFAGPDDPRLDRFAAILAHAGLLVLAPFLPDLCALRLDPRLLDHTEQAFDALLGIPERPAGRPGVFSISFGSLPALRLAATRSPEMGALVVFGGYADWQDTVRFCLHGTPGRPHDPLNRPVVFLNTVSAPAAVEAAWRAFVHETWGDKAMKAEPAWTAVAERLGRPLEAPDRRLFLQGCGIEPGGPALVKAALTTDQSWLDPRPHLASITCPVHLVHGAEDDVIPYTEAERLARHLPPTAHPAVHITGLYGHGGGAGVRAGALLEELRTMTVVLNAIVRSSR